MKFSVFCSVSMIGVVFMTLLFFPVYSAAQEENVIFRNLTPEEGLPLTTVLDVAQDSYGFIWIGSWDGTYRYDGRTFERIHFQGRYLAADHKGGMWISVNRDGPIAYYHPDADSLTYYEVPNFNGAYPITVVDAAGRVWNETPVGLYGFNENTNTFELDASSDSTYRYVNITPHADSSMSFLYRNTQGMRGVGHRSKDGTFSYEQYPIDKNISGSIDYNNFYSGIDLASLRDNGLLFMNFDHGWWAYKEHYDDHEWTFVEADKKEILSNGEEIITYEGDLYLVIEDGLAKLNILTGQSVTYHQDPSNSASILPVDVNSFGRLYIDRQDILWVPSFSYGISRLNLYDSDFGLLRDEEGKPIRDVISAVELEDGSFWVGSRIQDYALQHFDTDRKVIGQYKGYFNSPAGRTVGSDLSHPYVWSLTRGSDGSIWAGTGSPSPNHGGLNRIRPGSEQVVRFKHDPDNEASIYEGNWINNLTEDGSGRIWMKDFDKLAWIDPQTEVITRFNLWSEENSLPTGFHYMKTQDGNLIFSFDDNRYFRLHHEDLTLETLSLDTGESGSVYIVHQDEFGVFWVANNYGFGRIDSTLSIIENWHSINDFNLPVTVFSSLQIDDENNIWLATDNGLIKFDPDTNSYTHYTYERGLQGNNFENRVSYKGPSGKIYFGDNGGINIFDPATIQINPYPPDIVLTDLKLDGEDISLPPGQSIFDLLYTDYAPEISPDISTINLSFAALHFAGNNSNQFEYKLEGFDPVWRSGGNIGQATYTNLTPGDYTFIIRASNLDGVWSDGTSALSFTVLPPWYLTWWAYGIYAVLMLIGLVSFNRYQRNKLMQEEREQARQKELEQARKIEKAYRELEATHQELKNAQEQLIQQEKLASLGQLTAGIAHEIKNPLNFVNNFSELSVELMEEAREELAALGDEASADLLDILDAVEKNLKKIYEHGSRADSIVKSMLQHSRGGTGKMEAVELNALVKEYVNLSFHGMRAGEEPINVDIEMQLDDSIGEIPLIEEDFSRVIVNLVNNAFDAMRDKWHAEPESTDKYKPVLKVRTRIENEFVLVEIEDNGQGIPDDMKDKVLQPFFTTKKGTQGTGLGLSITNDIIKAHRGHLKIDSKYNDFTIFKVYLSK